MVFEGKSINDITEQDLLDLINNSTQEGQNIDFKIDAYQVPSQIIDPAEKQRQKTQKHESLCTDISAFANTSGGWIICGMEETKGFASKLVGLSISNMEQEISRLGQVAKAGVEPSPYGVQVRGIILQDGKLMIVIRILQSYNSPHRVKDTGKFHVRRSNRNDEMTMDELRNQFTFAGSFRERAKAFWKERVEAISIRGHEDIPFILDGDTHIVLHFIPLASFMNARTVDLSVFIPHNYVKWVQDTVIYQGNNLYGGRYSLNGYAITKQADYRDEIIDEYLQIFRDGTMEFVSKPIFSTREVSSVKIFLSEIEKAALQSLKSALLIQKYLLTVDAFAVMLSIVNAKDKILITGEMRRDAQSIPLRKKHLFIPDIVVEDPSERPETILKPLFDMLWNAVGFQKSDSYDQNGNWNSR